MNSSYSALSDWLKKRSLREYKNYAKAVTSSANGLF